MANGYCRKWEKETRAKYKTKQQKRNELNSFFGIWSDIFVLAAAWLGNAGFIDEISSTSQNSPALASATHNLTASVCMHIVSLR